MKLHFYGIRNIVLTVIDFFYPPFKKLMPLHAFRYIVSGGINTLVGLVTYYIVFKFILHEKDLDIGFYTFKSYAVSTVISFIVAMAIGFFLMKYVVFDDSNTKGRVQLFRYLILGISNLVLDYTLQKIAVEILDIYPVFAKIGTTIIVILLSYLVQRYLIFKKATEPVYFEKEE